MDETKFLFFWGEKNKKSVKTLQREIEVMLDLNHVNIVRYLGSQRVDNILNIFLEYVPGGSIHHLLSKFTRFSETVTRSFTQQILTGLHYLHSHRIVHRGTFLLPFSSSLPLSLFLPFPLPPIPFCSSPSIPLALLFPSPPPPLSLFVPFLSSSSFYSLSSFLFPSPPHFFTRNMLPSILSLLLCLFQYSPPFPFPFPLTSVSLSHLLPFGLVLFPHQSLSPLFCFPFHMRKEKSSQVKLSHIPSRIHHSFSFASFINKGEGRGASYLEVEF